jgi:cellulose synthase/poly-beta-1,6-N-acetylglucosamine synthase-like glycosyltransferase
MYRSAGLAEIGGFPEHDLSEDVATSFNLTARGWKTSFRPEAVVATEVPTSLGHFWRQRQRWARGLSRASGHARSLQALLAASGYLDRFIFLAAVVAVGFGSLAWFWPALYFVGPALNIWAALRQAHVSAPVVFLLGLLPMFVVDVFATVYGTLSSLRYLKPFWSPARQR